MVPFARALRPLLALLSFAAPAAAQCVGNDGLDLAPCCAPVVPNLPQFTAASLPGLGIRWQNCLPNAQNPLKVSWTHPGNPSCTEYSTALTVSDAGTGQPLLSGKMTLDYTRTWQEASPIAGPYQVWRMVAKADLFSIVPAAGAPLVPVPECVSPIGPPQSCFWYGYVDYASLCGTTLMENSIVLYHGCDFLQHKPGLSSRPGAFHPNRSYGIVAPHTAAQPFTPGLFPAPGGALMGEGLRETISPAGPGFCVAEDRIAGGIFSPFAQGCMCPPMAAPPQATLGVHMGSGTCPSTTGVTANFASQLISFPTIPWPHLIVTSIGNWNAPNVFPGNERAYVAEGLYRTQSSCNLTNQYEVYYGAMTRDGIPHVASTPSAANPNMIDLADNYSTLPTGGAPLPILGHMMPTQRLIYTSH